MRTKLDFKGGWVLRKNTAILFAVMGDLFFNQIWWFINRGGQNYGRQSDRDKPDSVLASENDGQMPLHGAPNLACWSGSNLIEIDKRVQENKSYCHQCIYAILLIIYIFIWNRAGSSIWTILNSLSLTFLLKFGWNCLSDTGKGHF